MISEVIVFIVKIAPAFLTKSSKNQYVMMRSVRFSSDPRFIRLRKR